MFASSVFNTKFCGPAADDFFAGKIYGDDWSGDKTLVSTLRALLMNRIGDNVLRVYVRSISMSSIGIDGKSPGQITELLHDKFDCGDNSFTVGYFYSSSKDGYDKLFKHAEEHFADRGGWTKIDAITAFFKRSFDVLCFINTERKKTLFIVKGYDLRRHHYLPIATYPSMPWYFDPKRGDKATDAELALLNSLCENTPEKYLDSLEAIASQVDFEQEYIRKSLGGIDTEYEKARIQTLKREIERSMGYFREYQEKINQQLTTINAKNIEIIGLENKLRNSDGESMLVGYFIANKRLRLDSVEGTRVYFHVNDYISYFDESMADRLIDNKGSSVYSYAPNKTAAERLARAIFIDQTIRVRTCAGYYVDISGSFDAISGCDFGADSYDRLPNPHIDRFACLGNYQSRINDRLANRDLIGVFEYAVASAKSLNFGDYTVMDDFFRKLYDGQGGKCFELEDGTKMDIKEVMTYLKEKETEERKDE